MPRFLLVILSALFVFALPLHAVAAEKAFVITQKHYFLGQWRIELCPDRVRATNLSENYCVIAIAPSWEVVVYRDDSHKLFRMPMSTFLRKGLAISNGYVTSGQISIAEHVAVKYKGLDTTLYTFLRTPAKETPAKPAWTLSDVPKDLPVANSQYWVAPFITTDKVLCAFVQRLLMMPRAPGYPVAFSDTRIDRSKNAVLTTSSCKVELPSRLAIEYPKKFTVCKTENDVTVSPENREGINEFAKSLGSN